MIWKAKLKLLDNIGLKLTNLINSIEITLSDCAPTPIFMSKNTIFWGVFCNHASTTIDHGVMSISMLYMGNIYQINDILVRQTSGEVQNFT